MGRGPENSLNKTPRRIERQTTPLKVGLVLLAAAPFIIRACNNDLGHKPYPHEPTPSTPIVRQK